MAAFHLTHRSRRRLRRAIRTLTWPLVATLTLLVMLVAIPGLYLPVLWGAISERVEL